ncbi:hypothetical protein [Azospira oryzae]|uniref:hypothetical protein n=1 Tax=Azospira oryzae TaxID=146939 RepID=UPI00138A3805|nr:hypothetical protein [Azospira oryzae]
MELEPELTTAGAVLIRALVVLALAALVLALVRTPAPAVTTPSIAAFLPSVAATPCNAAFPLKRGALIASSVVNQRAKLTRQPGISALNFDHPG